MTTPDKSHYLAETIEHIDITRTDVVPLVEAMRRMAFSARDLARAADIYDRMLRDPDCGIILCLAGSLISAGLKKVFAEMVRSRMVDAIVSTGANIADQDFFEALGFRHDVAEERLRAGRDDGTLRDLHIDLIVRHADRRRGPASLRRDDGALSGSTHKEASSWGKVDTAFEQMVFAEATLAVPLIIGYAYHKGAWRSRESKHWNQSLEPLRI